MEFFNLFNAIFQILCDPYAAEQMGFQRLTSYRALIIVGCIYAIIYVFKAISLYTMAKKAGKNKLIWCAFIPVVSTYLLGKLAGETKFFNVKIKNIGLIAMLVELVSVVLCLLVYIPQIYIIEGGYYIFETGRPLESVYGPWKIGKISSTIYNVFTWAETLVFVFLYITLFRKYYLRGHVVFTIFSALFPISAFFLFAVRNNDPIDYEKVMRERMERMRRALQNNPNGPYGNPYNTYGNPYNNPYNQGGQVNREPEDPFGEFGNSENKKETEENTQDVKNGDDTDDGYFN